MRTDAYALSGSERHVEATKLPARGLSDSGRIGRRSWRLRLSLLAMVSALTLVLVAPSAQAAIGLTGEFGSTGSGDGQFAGVRGIDVHSASGDVYVVDGGNNRVQRFDADGNYLAQFGSSGTGDGQFDNPSDIAVDQADGSFYVTNNGDNPSIQKFDSNGVFVLKFGEAVGSGDGEFAFIAQIAVAPDGSVYVVDDGNNRVQRFDSAGTYLSQFGATGEDQLFSPGSIAVDSNGDLFVRDIDPDTFAARLQKVTPGGEFISDVPLDQFGPITNQKLALDRSTGRLYVEGFAPDFTGLLVEYDSAGVPLDDLGGVSPTTWDLAASNSLGYIADVGDRVVTFRQLPAPSVTTGAASGVTATSATVAGEVDPNGFATTCHFEYVDDAGFQSTGFANAADIDCASAVGSGEDPVAVSADVLGLQPSTTYHYRLVATSENGTTEGAALQLTTPAPPAPPAPLVTTDAATSISQTAATLNGTVDPNGAATTYQFEYGTSPSLGSVVPAAPADAGSGTAAVARAQSLTGLTPNTTYHYRLVATNAGGTTNGPVLTFKTAAPVVVNPPVTVPPDDTPPPPGKKSAGLKIGKATVKGGRLVLSGKIAKGATKKLKVVAACGKTKVTKFVKPKRGKWAVRLKLRGACATAARARLTVTYAGDANLKKASAKRRVRLSRSAASR